MEKVALVGSKNLRRVMSVNIITVNSRLSRLVRETKILVSIILSLYSIFETFSILNKSLEKFYIKILFKKNKKN